MTQDKLLSGLKKDVRSLLISAKHGLTPEQLKKDYQSMLGHPMPLKALGFCSVLDMVKEMPDVVRLEFDVNGGAVLKAIGDRTTKGIEELVSKQRDQKSKNSRTRSSPFRFPHHKPPLLFLPRRGTVVPALSAQLRSQLRQLLHHGPINISELEARYGALFGRPLTVTQYGYYSIAEMLDAASDMIMVRQGQLGSYLILKTLVPPEEHVSVLAPLFSNQSVRITNSFPRTPYKSAPRQKVVLNSMKTTEQQKVKKYEDVRAQKAKPVQPSPEAAKEEHTFEKSVAKLEEELRQKIIEDGPGGTVSQELKDKLRKVVAEHTQGMTIHSLPIEYKKMYGEDLPLAQWGFQNVTEMVGALSDTFHLQPGPEDGATHLLIMEHKQHDSSLASESDVLQSAESLNPSSEGYYFSCSESAWDQQDNADESAESLESDTEIRVTNRTVHPTVDVFPVKVVSRSSMIPLDALQSQTLKAPTRRKERELVPVLVEKVESPSHFYIRFDENQESRTLENLMIEMRSCYSCPEVAERYRLPDAFVRPGQACCVAPKDLWFYRVVIHRMLSNEEVEVYYVDFGDVTTVKRSSLRFLKSCYAELAAQAIPSALVGVKPSRGTWTKDATSTFQKLCSERTLVAAVHSYQEDFLLLFLCDTHTEEDLYIHAVLQTEGSAISCSPSNTPIFEQFNPVKLYLGEGRLEEVVIPCSDITDGQNPSKLDLSSDSEIQATKDTDDLLDLPELEFIHVAQGENNNPFSTLLNKAPAGFSNWDQDWVDENTPHHESKPAQNCQEEIVKSTVESVVEPQLFSKLNCESEESPVPTSTIQSISLNTSDQNHHCSPTDLAVESFSPPPCSLMFPVFSTGERLAADVFFRHASPLAVSPAARMAAGSSLHHWYPHKQA